MAVPKAAICKWLILFSLFSQAFISRAQLTANFSATPISGCAPLLVNFTDLSTGNPTSWKWDLGNGTTSFLKNPAVTYFAPGKYNVKLIKTTDEFEDKLTKLLDYLEQDNEGVEKLVNDAGGYIQVYSSFHNGNTMIGGHHLEKDHIKRLSKLNLEIDFDISADGNFFT